MRTTFLIILGLHGIIHLLGFVKGFGIIEVKALSLPISKPMGLLWLTSAALLLGYATLHFMSYKYDWLVGFVAVLLSQLLVLLFWTDAKFGTLPNLLILAVSLISFGTYQFRHLIEKETAQLISPIMKPHGKVVTENDLLSLPVPVANWLKRSGMVGKPHIILGKVSQQAEMKMKPGQQNWMQATARQYSVIDRPSFIWMTKVKMNSWLYFLGRDKFDEGKGEMLIKMNSLLNVVDEKGPKIDEGSLQRYLGEMVWFPSLALSPYVTWQAVDDHAAKATLKYLGTEGSGTFFFNEAGDFVKFSAMRFKGNDEEAQRYEWVLHVEDYQVFEGIKIPSKMSATWKLDEGDWTWLRLTISDVAYNENALPWPI